MSCWSKLTPERLGSFTSRKRNASIYARTSKLIHLLDERIYYPIIYGVPKLLQELNLSSELNLSLNLPSKYRRQSDLDRVG